MSKGNWSLRFWYRCPDDTQPYEACLILDAKSEDEAINEAVERWETISHPNARDPYISYSVRFPHRTGLKNRR